MREGLRSGDISVKAEVKLMSERENEVNDEKKNLFDLNDETTEKEDSGSTSPKGTMEIKEIDEKASDECGETGLGENDRNSSRVDCVVKEDSKVKNAGTVFWSGLGIKSGNDKESNKIEIEEKDRNTGCDGSENERGFDVHVEGLRSGSISVKPEDKFILGPESEVIDKKRILFDLNDEIIPFMDFGPDSVKENIKTKENDAPINDECGEIGLDGNKRKRSRVYGEELGEDVVVKKRLKEDITAKNVGRVLRSRLGIKRGSEKESNQAEIEERGSNRVFDGSENERDVDMQMEVSNETNGAKGRKKVKRKRGRPPKMLENDESEGEQTKISKVKPGRPPKLNKIDESCEQRRKKVKDKRGRPRHKTHESGESDGEQRKRLKNKLGRPRKDGSDDRGSKRLKKKRGRPPKLQGINEVLKGKVGKGKKVNGIRKSQRHTLAVGLKRDVPTYGLIPEKRHGGTEFNAQRFAPDKKNSCAETGEAISRQTMKTVNQREKKCLETHQEETLSKHGAKQLLRDRIVELLLAAGWKIEYRPRNGREYCDAVYVNPEGKTHWSITLAYSVLKNHYEQEGGSSDTSKTGFTFTPIPEDELSILKKVINKSRSDRNKKKKGKNLGTDGEIVTKKKKKKGKTNSAASPHGKSQKRGIKGKPSVSEGGTSHNGMSIPARRHKLQETQQRKRCALLVRNSVEGEESNGDGFVAYDGKWTLLAWMIDTGTVPLNEKVQYWNQRKTRVMLQGRIARDGIRCDCCSEIFTISKFDTHSKSKLCHPFQNLYFESGSSLLQCILDSWNKQDESKRKGFHFVNFDGEDPNDDTCGICGDGGDLICCDGCPSTFHQNCLDIKIFERLEKLLGVKHDLEGGYTWSLVHRFDVSTDLSLSDVCQKVECNARLAVALSVMDECFLPLPDHRSGINLIHNILYNFGSVDILLNSNMRSNFKRLNYKGFFTAILERDDEIISAASIRIHGKELAEMPFIGTRHMYRRQGMCRRLLTGIESALCSLNVEKLIIPAISELRETWTSVFGFQPLEVSSKQKMRNMSLLVFPGVDMLQKPMMKNQFPRENMISAKGLRSSELENPRTADEVGKNSDEKYSAGFDLNACINAAAPHVCKIHDKSAPGESTLQFPNGSTHDASGLTSETVNFPESTTDTNCIDQLGVTSNDLQANDKIAVNTLGSPSDADEQTEDTDDPNASSLAVKSIASEVQIEYGSAKQSLNSCDEASAQQSAEIIKHQSLGFLSELNVSSENVVAHDSVSIDCRPLDANVIIDQDHQQLPVVGCISVSGERKLETDKVKSDSVFSQISSVVAGDMKQALTESIKANHILRETIITSSCNADQASPSAPQRAQNDDCINSSRQANGLDDHDIVLSPINTDCHSPCVPFSDAPNKPDFPPCMSNGLCLSEDEMMSCKACVDDGPNLKDKPVSVGGSQICDAVFQVRIESSEQPESDSQVHLVGVTNTNCNCEPLCNLSPGSGVALHCASGGGNSHGTPEVMVLSNKAS
ncbi:PHD-type domain-containing protein [Citrus sinensis]|uniref:PHD-type domain-containing protein n=1 Tax=Citrus sinensis TaxID=2711 RepID=A0ACB8MJI3_CITSI|nr:PHD-type domain-containing protein [Citrus sinensis]